MVYKYKIRFLPDVLYGRPLLPLGTEVTTDSELDSGVMIGMTTNQDVIPPTTSTMCNNNNNNNSSNNNGSEREKGRTESCYSPRLTYTTCSSKGSSDRLDEETEDTASSKFCMKDSENEDEEEPRGRRTVGVHKNKVIRVLLCGLLLLTRSPYRYYRLGSNDIDWSILVDLRRSEVDLFDLGRICGV